MIKPHIQISLASPEKILKWTERISPVGELIGEIKNALLIRKLRLKINKNYNNRTLLLNN